MEPGIIILCHDERYVITVSTFISQITNKYLFNVGSHYNILCEGMNEHIGVSLRSLWLQYRD